MEYQTTPAEAAAATEAAQPTVETVQEESKTDIRSAIDSAFDAVEFNDEEPKAKQTKDAAELTEPTDGDPVEDLPEPEPEERERDENGRFKAKEAEEAPEEPAEPEVEPEPEVEAPKELTSFTEPPSRFSPDAKQAWAEAPEPIRAEITRAVEELEGGIEQYRETFEPYREFDKNIKASGQTFQEVLNHYTGMENMLKTDFIGGLDVICRNKGTSLQEVANQYVQRPPELIQQDSVINGLRGELAALNQQMASMSTNVTSQAEQALQAQIDAFSVDKPRFEELRADMGMLMDQGRAKTMQEAYTMAERLNPGADPVAPTTPAEPTAAQTRDKARLSVTGAPSSGSNPRNRKTPSSARDAVDSAFDQLGI